MSLALQVGQGGNRSQGRKIDHLGCRELQAGNPVRANFGVNVAVKIGIQIFQLRRHGLEFAHRAEVVREDDLLGHEENGLEATGRRW